MFILEIDRQMDERMDGETDGQIDFHEYCQYKLVKRNRQSIKLSEKNKSKRPSN